MEPNTKSDCDRVTFLMIGSQRCGTTWTDAALRTHPHVYLPEKKQSYFFDRNYDKGLNWYLEKFQDVLPQHVAVGEVATGYCLLHAIPRMAKHFPNVKLMMVMRNPVERAYSNFQSRQTEEGWNSFEDALTPGSELLERGHYIDQIECILKHYDQKNILFLLYDDLSGSDGEYIKRVYDFIGVDSDIKSKMIGQRKNSAMFPSLRRFLHQLGLKPLVSCLSNSWVGDSIRRSRKKKGKAYRPMKQETKETLIAHFLPYNDRLAEFLGRDLSKWNES